MPIFFKILLIAACANQAINNLNLKNMSDEILNLINKAKTQAKRDAIMGFVTKNSKVAIKIAVAVFLVAIMAISYSIYQKSQQEKYSEKLHRALVDQQIGETEKFRAALKEIAESKSAPGGVKSLASLRYSALLVQEGKQDEAVKIYLNVADCGSCEDYTRDLARLLVVKVWMADPAELAKEDLASRIKKLEDASDILKLNIAEQRALLELNKGNREEAKKIFSEIEKDAEKHPSLKARAADGIKMSEKE